MFLMAASYVFYAAWRPEFLILIIGSTTVDYIAGRLMSTADQHRKKRILTLSICVNLGLLAIFKYARFAYESAVSIAQVFETQMKPWQDDWGFALPVGISFYTFQSMSYTIDVYRGRLKPETNFFRFALFVAYFPQLVAGPIEKARHLLGELKVLGDRRVIDPPAALYQVSYGLFKKVVIADNIAAIIDPIFSAPSQYSGGTLAIAAFLFSIQIYCDFSGYTDIAIGISKLLGIRLSLNFAYPYFSKNITEFWRTWHISLSSWLKEYLYFSLGGNRQSPRRTQFNLMATMLLGGLWHGASWNFVLWGGLHGLYLVAHKRFMGLMGTSPTSPRTALAAGWAIPVTFVVVTLTWIPFRCETFSQTYDFLSGIIGMTNGTMTVFNDGVLFFVVCMASSLLILDILERRGCLRDDNLSMSGWVTYRFVITAGFFLASQILGSEQAQQFIYFQF